jgi:hypothetical protein
MHGFWIFKPKSKPFATRKWLSIPESKPCAIRKRISISPLQQQYRLENERKEAAKNLQDLVAAAKWEGAKEKAEAAKPQEGEGEGGCSENGARFDFILSRNDGRHYRKHSNGVIAVQARMMAGVIASISGVIAVQALSQV